MKTLKTIFAFMLTIFWCLAPILAGDSLGDKLSFLCFWYMGLIVVMPIVFYLIKK